MKKINILSFINFTLKKWHSYKTMYSWILKQDIASQGISQNEFFEGYSVPRNKKLIRIFKDLGLVEQFGSAVPRILSYYDKKCFKFSIVRLLDHSFSLPIY